MSKKRLTPTQIWSAPAVLGALTAIGLTTALFSDSAGDMAAWLTLSAPVVVVAWYSGRRDGDTAG